MAQILSTVARKGKLITTSAFKGYDHALNTYVGCQFGCKYCYVRFFIKDPNRPWGEFVRRREHVADRLPKELKSIAGQRLVLGTMTDPYQPEERKHRITRAALEIIKDSEDKPSKVGIFTRSPIVLDDAETIAQLPRARVHFSITPFTREIMTKIEGIPVQTSARWNTIRKLKQAGVRIHVNVAPAIPVVSDSLTEEYCGEMADIGVDEFFVDPMQAYSESYEALKSSMAGDKNWPKVEEVMTDKARYQAWKDGFKADWQARWIKAGAPAGTLAIWCDHVSKVWEDLVTGQPLDPRWYGDDLIAPPPQPAPAPEEADDVGASAE